MAWVIGLTGGIGSGKSTVASYFSELGVPVIDADNVGRELCFPGHPAFKKIVDRFGNSIVDLNGEIDRKMLGKIVFENSVERVWLENVLHPLIIEIIVAWVKELSAHYCIVVAPLLLETSLKEHVNRILVVDAEEETQIRRAAFRDKREENQIKSILDKQLSREERIKWADDIILNDRGLDALRKKVEKLNALYTHRC